MSYKIISLVLFFLYSHIRCNGQQIGFEQPVVSADIIMKDLLSLLKYNQQHLNLSEDYDAYDEKKQNISKEAFLASLASGNYLPIRMRSTSTPTYVLYKLPSDIDEDIKTTLQSLGKKQYDFYKREGTRLGGFNFVDINGVSYTSENTKNKIVVIKCWFIACLPCIQEMPALNQLKDQYKARKDILFISLAFDSKKALEAFLKRKQFDYAVIPNKAEYLTKDLKIPGYPTHIIINKEGLISKVVSTVNEVKSALYKEASKFD